MLGLESRESYGRHRNFMITRRAVIRSLRKARPQRLGDCSTYESVIVHIAGSWQVCA